MSGAKKILYIECQMGAAGDMLLAALSELLPDSAAFYERLNAMGLPGVSFAPKPAVKSGIRGTRAEILINGEEEGQEGGFEFPKETQNAEQEGGFEPEARERHNYEPEREHRHNAHEHEHNEHERTTHEHSHAHRSLKDVLERINALSLPGPVRAAASEVYGIIAEAESAVHGRPVADIHFHEVGRLDAIADVAGVCLALAELAPEQILVSPVNTGGGTVRCAHGVLPVPAPAAARILSGVPVYSDGIKGELCTPTGAALLKYFASEFTSRDAFPEMIIEKTGYGMGAKDFDRPNCVRAFLGRRAGKADLRPITELSCDIDDQTPEELAFAQKILLEAGALDALTRPVYMKKNRAGVTLSCLCEREKADAVARLMLLHTTTLGVRRLDLSRYELERSVSEISTPYGPARLKTASGFGITKVKPEYDDMEKIASERGLTLSEVRKAVLGGLL
ncbi:MAG: nickel pincer cofactor biosynthesis protein LarC [Clostridiales bacterium]|jgi:uncharacterized protein (TIGR00299 family) protein|nr:nickel pincer cofactor biosynthesis protein LarC [Clostridiales bacterium]